MKVDELRELEEDQLEDRMRTARRELYELRFKHAVGQLENSSQINKVRHDIARIMTVLSERELGIVTHIPHESTASATAVAVADPNAGFEPETPAAEVAEAPKPKRTRKAKTTEETT
jgi:large subunit ribosomal protein L29